MAQKRYSRGGGKPWRGGEPEQSERLKTSDIVLKAPKGEQLPVDLFDTVASHAAKTVAAAQRELNKPTQLRQFYDEVVMWHEKVRRDEERFREYLPFIRMLNAKAAYAKGRKHVDADFVRLINHCLQQVDSAEALRNFKLFFEAFMGFYKSERPSG